ncbi:hypothetical protein J6590_010792 [Homalodisca vitripennis]|nr:hypothetical protein J6590_010792 [Homalodisca vitripennis]
MGDRGATLSLESTCSAIDDKESRGARAGPMETVSEVVSQHYLFVGPTQTTNKQTNRQTITPETGHCESGRTV